MRGNVKNTSEASIDQRLPCSAVRSCSACMIADQKHDASQGSKSAAATWQGNLIQWKRLLLWLCNLRRGSAGRERAAERTLAWLHQGRRHWTRIHSRHSNLQRRRPPCTLPCHSKLPHHSNELPAGVFAATSKSRLSQHLTAAIAAPNLSQVCHLAPPSVMQAVHLPSLHLTQPRAT